MSTQPVTAQTVIITGASAGVGRATAKVYARRGCRLGLIARGAAGLEAAKRECEAEGAERVATVQCDVADADAVFAAARTFEAELGPPDVWINNAMVSVFAPSWEITPREHARVMQVNYLGTVHGTLAALESMRVRGRGTIMQVGSVLAYRGIPFQSAYCASKHAIQGFVDSLRPELMREHPGINVGMVQLPAVNTPQFSWVRTRLPRHPRPMGGKLFSPGAVAEAIAWAADHGAREVTVGGQAIKTRIANAILPGWLDSKLAAEGYEGQQTDEIVDPRKWRDNVDAPLDTDRDYGTEGEFKDEAASSVMLKAQR